MSAIASLQVNRDVQCTFPLSSVSGRVAGKEKKMTWLCKSDE